MSNVLSFGYQLNQIQKYVYIINSILIGNYFFSVSSNYRISLLRRQARATIHDISRTIRKLRTKEHFRENVNDRRPYTRSPRKFTSGRLSAHTCRRKTETPTTINNNRSYDLYTYLLNGQFRGRIQCVLGDGVRTKTAPNVFT